MTMVYKLIGNLLIYVALDYQIYCITKKLEKIDFIVQDSSKLKIYIININISFLL